MKIFDMGSIMYMCSQQAKSILTLYAYLPQWSSTVLSGLAGAADQWQCLADEVEDVCEMKFGDGLLLQHLHQVSEGAEVVCLLRIVEVMFLDNSYVEGLVLTLKLSACP